MSTRTCRGGGWGRGQLEYYLEIRARRKKCCATLCVVRRGLTDGCYGVVWHALSQSTNTLTPMRARACKHAHLSALARTRTCTRDCPKDDTPSLIRAKRGLASRPDAMTLRWAERPNGRPDRDARGLSSAPDEMARSTKCTRHRTGCTSSPQTDPATARLC
jgi:hypothetical protein